MTSKQRIKIAKNSSDPKELKRLAYDNSERVRETVLRNDNTPDNVRQMLCEELQDSKIDDVRYTVAEHTDDPEIFAHLANDEDKRVREVVAKRTDDSEILEQLANDSDRDVKQIARKRLGITSPKKSKTPPKTDWSIPLYSITNYSEIQDEIDEVIRQAADAYCEQTFGGYATVDIPDGVYDNGGSLNFIFHTPEGVDEYMQIDADDLLGPATSQNMKSKCVKKLIAWMERNLKF